MRIEQRGRDWVRTWAFPVDERKTKREGFDANAVSGSMTADDEYPGCPHCGETVFVQCRCGKIGCAGGVRYHSNYADYTCPWCRDEIAVQGAYEFNVSGGGY
jgi:predicted RNA-binding Zn-ribbon protein involved in translation (DUF1610 family)